MKKRLRYKIVLTGEYEVDPCDCDTNDVDEIAEIERDWAAADIANFIANYQLVPTEILILPV
jgi:hypothetical protein